MAYSQDRLIKITSPLGDDAFTVMGFSAVEGLSSLYQCEIDLISDRHDIDFHRILGENVSLYVEMNRQQKFLFNGIICRFFQGSGGGEQGSDTRYSSYHATLVPRIWLATQTKKIRLWRDVTSADVIRTILSEYGCTGNLAATSFTHEYVIQYNETDFNVIARLLEDEDMYYCFRHNPQSTDHEFLTVKPPGNPRVVGTMRYQTTGGATVIDEEIITELSVMEEIKPNVAKLSDLVPSKTVNIVEGQDKTEAFPSELPVREYPGNIEDPSRADLKAKIRLGVEQANKRTIHGASDCFAFRSGIRFTLSGYYRREMNDKDYLLTTVEHNVQQDLNGEFTYSNRFACIPAEVLYRSPRRAERPRVQGTQTAVVTEMPNQDGWIKVKVPWAGEQEEQVEHPKVRVMQPWGGGGHGGVFVPRLDHEVVLDFIDGDPHKPIVTGRVYNLNNIPGYAFTSWTKTSIKTESMSSAGVRGTGANELTFDDETGREHVLLHAQKNMDVVVKNDQTNTVGHDFTETIKNNATIKITDGVYDHDVATGTAVYHVKSDIVEKYDANQSTTAKQKITIKSESADILVEAATSIELHVGQSRIRMNANGQISIEGVDVTISGSGLVTVRGGSVHSQADAEHQTRGAIVLSEGSATNTIRGGMVMLNP